jgi:hypothetical protein
MSENQTEVGSVSIRATEVVVAKKVAEIVLKKLDDPRYRGGRQLAVHTADGELKVYRDNAQHRIVIEHPRVGSISKETNRRTGEISCRISNRGVYVSSGSNIRDFEKFLNENPLTLSYFSLLH